MRALLRYPVVAAEQASIPLAVSAASGGTKSIVRGAMLSKAQLQIGDRVTHYREGENVGSVVNIRRPWWAFFGRVYWVQWREDVLPVLIHNGLQQAHDSRRGDAEPLT